MDLTINDLFTGKVYFYKSEMESTNDFARELLNQKPLPADGTAIIAGHQTKGRGRRGKEWNSPAGLGISTSVIYFPKQLKASDQFRLNQVVCLAMVDYLRSLTFKEVKIKWPNDILLEGGKIAGLLIENQVIGDYIQWSIIGMGLNLNQTKFPDNIENAVSLTMVTGEPYLIVEEIPVLYTYLEQRYLQLNDSHKHISLDYYMNLFGYQEQIQFERDGLLLEGKVLNVGPMGELIMDVQGEQQAYKYGEIQIAYPKRN